jgi:hypothetical protein
LHVLQGEAALAAADPGGIDVFAADLAAFRAALTAENRTLKRALIDPRILSGIGNAYSDEILHAAMLSPVTLTHKLTPEEWSRLYAATRDTLRLWVDRLRSESRAAFPEKVTAFRPEMAVHGRYGKPCPRCGEPVQRIRYADNETNYCARCQSKGSGAPLTALLSALFSCWLLLLRWTRAAFAASCLVSVGTIFTAGFAMFPLLMPSSDNAGHSLTVWEASSSEQVLRITLTVGTAMIPLALACVAWCLLALRRRDTLQTVSAQT